MKMTNKKIIAALLIAATLTGCDSLNNKAKDAEEDTQVENTVDEKEAEKAGEEEADTNDSTEDAEGEEGKEDTKEGEDTEGAEGEEANSEEDATSEAETDSGQTAVERLEDAIFNNRVQARAAEILLEETPESLTDEFKAKLEDLLEKSNDIIERSEKALEAYK